MATDTTVDSPVVNGNLTGLDGAVGAPGTPAAGPGRQGLDAPLTGVNDRDKGLRNSGSHTIANSGAGARDIVDGDTASAAKFGQAGLKGPGSGGLGSGGGGNGLDAFKSNMLAPGSMLQSAFTEPLQAVQGLTRPLEGALSAPQQLLSPLNSILGGGGAPGGLGGSLNPMSAVGSTGGSGGLSGDLKSRLDQFVSSTAGRVDYAWGGGHGDGAGPTTGRPDGGGAGDAHGDYAKSGVDCSGFTRWAYAEVTGHDVLGKSTSESQFAGGRAVGSPRPMDVAFPPSAFSGGGGPHHVQLYLGDGMIAEAPQSGEKVRIRPVSPGTQFRRYLPD
ncbi:C40 family peptidase [Mycobacterium sp. MUNTM1]